MERWLEQLALEERGSSGAGREAGGQEVGRALEERGFTGVGREIGGQEGESGRVRGGQWGGGAARSREREEKQAKERKTKKDESFDMVSP